MRHSPLLVAALLVLSHGLAQPQQPLPPSPARRIVIAPSPATMIAQDTLRLRVQALDASGDEVPNVTFRFVPSSGARFEGTVTEDGLVRSGATGTLPITVIANLRDMAPVTERIEVVMVPAAPGRIELVEPVRKLLVGQQVQLTARVYSIHGDPRDDAITWRASSSNVTIADGWVKGVRPGRATLTAVAGPAAANHELEVIADNVRALTLTPSSVRVVARAMSSASSSTCAIEPTRRSLA